MKKKLWTMLLALSLVVGLAGCKSNTGGTSDNQGAEVTNPQAEVTASADADTLIEPCTLTFLSWYPLEKYQPILEAFASEYPDIKIEFQYAAPVADYLEKMQVLTSTGEVPDLFYISAENKTEMISNGYCADITNTEAVSKLVDVNRQTYEADGIDYGFAPTTWVGGYFYNKDIFSELGLEAPKTWDEFLNVCAALKENGTRPIIERGEWFWDSFLGPFMNDYLANDPNYHQEVIDGTKTFADGWGPYIEKWYNDLVVPGYIDEDLVSVSSQEFFSEFATGNTGMLAGHAGHLLEVQKLNPDFEIGFFPMPGTESDIKVAYGAVDCAVAISSKTKYAKQAEIFLNFISRDDIIQLYQQMNGYVIGMKGITSNVDPILSDVAKMYSDGQISVYIPQGNWGAYGTGLQQQLISSSQQLLLKEIDSKTLIQQMQDKLTELKDE
jgi:raffinose/stachyose/melibiose transport system substrate-binding protein